MTDQTTRFQLPLLAAGQAQKEVTHNEALFRLDAACSPAVEGPPLASPPELPTAGQAWIVADGATGAWSGYEGTIAVWTSAGWRFLPGVEGMLVWRRDTATWMFRNGDGWQGDRLPVPALAIDGQIVVGPQQPAIAAPAGGAVVDAECRAALIAILDALRTHGLVAR